MTKREKILVVSTHYKKAYPIVKSLSKAGYDVLAAQYFKSGIPFSKYIFANFRVTNPSVNILEYISQLKKIIYKHNPQMIIPVGFIDTIAIAQFKDLFPLDLIIPISHYHDIVEVSKKSNLSKIAKEVGVKYPKTVRFSEFDINNSFLPVVIKKDTNGSIPEYVFDKQTLKKKLIGFENKIIQEFISGYGCGYFALCKDGKIILEFAHKRIIESKPSGGPSIVASSYNDPEISYLGRKIVENLNWEGVIMVEFRRNTETGDYYLIEINPKFWGSLELPVSLGFDFPRFLVELYLHNRVPKGFDFVIVYPKFEIFSWTTSGLDYLKGNYHIWLRILKYTFKGGYYFTDLHFDDPAYTFFNLLSKMKSLVLGSNRFDRELITNLQRKTEQIFKKTTFSHIFFDLDGTLVRLNIDWNNLRKEEFVKEHLWGWDNINMGLYKLSRTHKVSYVYRTLDNILKKYERSAIKHIKPNHKLRKLLIQVKKQYIKFGIVSKQSNSVITQTLEKMQLLGLFGSIIGRANSHLRRKQLQISLEIVGVLPENAIFVADRFEDFVAASSLGITPIAIATHPYIVQSLYEYGIPVFAKVEDFLELLIKVNKIKGAENNG